MCQHTVRFYDEAYPADSVSEFLAAGLEAGDRCLTLLTAPHRHAVEQCLRARGVAIERSAYVAVDSDEAWAQMQVNGRLDARRAHAMLEQLMVRPQGGGSGRVRAVGDLAPTLHAAGKIDDAVAFERLVHLAMERHGASTICAYPIHSQRREGRMQTLLRLSAEHTVVEFPQHLWAHHWVTSASSVAQGAC